MKKEKHNWNSMVGRLLPTLIPEHSRIFKLTPAQRKEDPEAVRLVGTKRSHFAPCYFANGNSGSPEKFLEGLDAVPWVRALPEYFFDRIAY